MPAGSRPRYSRGPLSPYGRESKTSLSKTLKMLSGNTGSSSRLGQCAAHSTYSPPNSLSTYVAALKTSQDIHREKISYRIGPGPTDKKYQITRAEQEQVTKAIYDALDRHILTREELAREIVKRTKIRPTLQSHPLSGFG